MPRGSADAVSFKAAPQTAEEFADQVNELTDLLTTLPATFSGTLSVHISRSGLTIEQLAEICGISEKTIQRYKASDENECELPILVTLCIGLKLHPILSFDLLSKAGYGTLKSSKKHTAYKLILLTMHECSIEQCHEYINAIDLGLFHRQKQFVQTLNVHSEI